MLEAGRKQPVITGELKDEDMLTVSQTIQGYSLVCNTWRESRIMLGVCTLLTRLIAEFNGRRISTSSEATRLEDSTPLEDRKDIAQA